MSSSSQSVERELSESVPGAPIEAVLWDRELDRRPSRPPDEQRLGPAVRSMLRGMTSSPETVLRSLTDAILGALQCDSAGISLINSSRTRFYWPAISGVWAPYIGGGTPLGFGPCGDVLNAGAALHMHSIHTRYTYFAKVALVKEVLLAPFSIDGQVLGTIWAVIHEPPNDLRSRQRTPSSQYDREDLRLLTGLTDLAAAAYKVWNSSPTAPRQ